MTGFTGTWPLIRLILRRDRIRIPVWFISILLVLVGTAASFPATYPTAETRQERADLITNPALALMLGPGFGLDDYTFGAMLANEMLGILCVVVALMNIFLVIRHTRAEEESERLELIRSSVVGRYANLGATLIVAAGLNAVLAGIIAVSLPAALDALTFEGSALFGVALASTGLIFAAVAAVLAQLNTFARGATGGAGAVLALTYAIRGFGDVQGNALTWFSPIGWAQQTAPYILNRWWPLAFSLLLFVALTVVAFALNQRRDLGAGLLAPRPGPVSASAMLVRPGGLAMRLQRGALLGWTIGLTGFAFGTGTMVSEVADMYQTNPVARDYLVAMGMDQADAVEAALALYISFGALFAGIFAVGSVTRLRTEETTGRAENVLATGVSRLRWAGSFLAVTVASTIGILCLAGLGSGMGYVSSGGHLSDVPSLLGAALAYAPALWIAAGVAVAVFGLAPRAMPLVWAVPAYALFTLMLGPLLGLPDWLYNVSPFKHVPRLPAGEFSIMPLLVMTGLAVLLIAAGLVGYRRRDMAP
jgi:ABC-2 type transport system permease protein